MIHYGMEKDVPDITAAVPIADCPTSTGPFHVLLLTTLRFVYVLMRHVQMRM